MHAAAITTAPEIHLVVGIIVPLTNGEGKLKANLYISVIYK